MAELTEGKLTEAERNDLVTEALDLVNHIVSELASRYPRHVDRNELWNAGALGLVEASRRFDPDAGIPFPRYAAIRIRGAIIDSTRTRDWASRSVRRQLREIKEAQSGLEEMHGRTPTQGELADYLDIEVSELGSRQAHVASSTLLHLDQPTEGDDVPLAERVHDEQIDFQPEAFMEQVELGGSLATAVEHLPDVQRDVIVRYYFQGELLQTIAAEMSLTEARVSQIRAEALLAIRSFFATVYEGVEPAPDSAPGKRARAAYVARMAEQTTWRSRIETPRLVESS